VCPTVVLWISAGLVVAAGMKEVLPTWLSAVAGIAFLLFSAITASSLRRALAPANWLVRAGADRMLVKFRSYLNADFPPELPHVLEIMRGEILAALATRLKLGGKDRSGGAIFETVVFLDLQLGPSIETSALAECLRRERELRNRGAAWRHYPVTLVDDHTIRIEWRSRHSRIKPSIGQALHLLGQPAVQAEERVNLGGSRSLPAAPDVAQIRSLPVAGTPTAVGRAPTTDHSFAEMHARGQFAALSAVKCPRNWRWPITGQFTALSAVK
jgi:hypothetical protein